MHPADLNIANEDHLAIVERQRAEALATIERVKALITAYEGRSGSAWAYVVKDLRCALDPADFPMPRKRPGYVPKPKMLTADPADLSAARDKTDADRMETS